MKVHIERRDGKPTFGSYNFHGSYEEHQFFEDDEAKCVAYISRLGCYKSIKDIKKLIEDDKGARVE